jgi:hypothetical protein
MTTDRHDGPAVVSSAAGMDDELRGLAFALRCAKADLLRFFIDQGMKDLAER